MDLSLDDLYVVSAGLAELRNAPAADALLMRVMAERRALGDPFVPDEAYLHREGPDTAEDRELGERYAAHLRTIGL